MSSHPHRSNFHTLLRVPITELPSTPYWVTNNRLPPNLVVPEPRLLQYFPIYVGDLPFDQHSEAQVRYGWALRLEVMMMLAGALAAENYCTE